MRFRFTLRDVLVVTVFLFTLQSCNSSNLNGENKSKPQTSASESVTAVDYQSGSDSGPQSDLQLPISQYRVGINFDDGGYRNTSSDRDYNDAVICFQGEFLVDSSKGTVVSSKAQKTSAAFSRRGLCDNAILVTIKHPDGSFFGPKEYRTNDGNTIYFTLDFRKKSELKVELLAGSNCAFSGETRPTSDADAAKVEIDVCRTSGN